MDVAVILCARGTDAGGYGDGWRSLGGGFAGTLDFGLPQDESVIFYTTLSICTPLYSQIHAH